MKKAITLLNVLLLTLFTNHAKGENTAIKYYSKNKETFQLQDMSKNQALYVTLKGKSKYSVIWIQIYYKGNKEDLFIETKTNGEFSQKYLMSKGKGEYQFKIFANDGKSSRYRGVCHFSINNTKELPKDLVLDAKIKYFGLQKKFFSLAPFKDKQASFLTLKGESKYKYIMMKVKYKNKVSSINFSPDKRFHYKYILSKGKGEYHVSFFGSNGKYSRYTGICSFKVFNSKEINSNDKIFNINSKIIQYIAGTLGKKIGRGECWDAAQSALELYGAEWDGSFVYGKKVDWKKDKIIPGDIIQFRSVVFRMQKNGFTSVKYYGQPDHTAIVYKVHKRGVYTLAHQNVEGKRIMLKGLINLNHKFSGWIQFYRPRAGLIKVK